MFQPTLLQHRAALIPGGGTGICRGRMLVGVRDRWLLSTRILGEA